MRAEGGAEQNSDEGEWTTVRLKKTRQRDKGVAMATFYFTNFPESLGVEPLWKMFTRWGYVVDVYVPNKRNREGKMFGFVQFDRVSEVKELEDQLRMIWIGLHKLRVNLSKFSRQSGSQVRHRAVDTGKLGSVEQSSPSRV